MRAGVYASGDVSHMQTVSVGEDFSFFSRTHTHLEWFLRTPLDLTEYGYGTVWLAF